MRKPLTECIVVMILNISLQETGDELFYACVLFGKHYKTSSRQQCCDGRVLTEALEAFLIKI